MPRKRVIATLAVAAAVLVVAAGAVTGQEGSASNRHGSGKRLAGTWIVTVERPPLPPLIVLQHVNADGTYLSYSGAGSLGDSPAGRSHEFGSWERIEGRLYASSGSWLRYDTQTGAHIGSSRANRNIRLSHDGDSFDVVTRVQSFDLDGNVITTFPARHGRGERMQIERIPDEP